VLGVVPLALLFAVSAGAAPPASPSESIPACELSVLRDYRDRLLAPSLKDNLGLFHLTEDCGLAYGFGEPHRVRWAIVGGYAGASEDATSPDGHSARFYSFSPPERVKYGWNPHGVLAMRTGDLILPALSYADTRLSGKFQPLPVAKAAGGCAASLVSEDHHVFLVERFFPELFSLGRYASEAELRNWVFFAAGGAGGEIGGSPSPLYPGVSYFYYTGADGEDAPALRKDGRSWIELRKVSKALLLKMVRSGKAAVNIYELDRRRSKKQASLERRFHETGVPHMEVVLLDEAARRELLPFLAPRVSLPEDFSPKPYSPGVVDLSAYSFDSLMDLEYAVRKRCRGKGVEAGDSPLFRRPIALTCVSFGDALDRRVAGLQTDCREGEAFFSRSGPYGKHNALKFGLLLRERPGLRAALCDKVVGDIRSWERKARPGAPCR